VRTVKFEARIRELVENLPDLAELVEPLLVVRRGHQVRTTMVCRAACHVQESPGFPICSYRRLGTGLF
jgi:hypothetical protein